MTGLKFLSTGSSLPEKILTNADLEKMVDTTDAWITERTGIKERHIAGPDEATSDISIRAARKALESAGLSPADIDMVVVATCTPDFIMPSTACLVQRELGLSNALAFDVGAACSGFLYGLACVNGFLQAGTAKTALLIGADALSKFTDWTDRDTCVLFGDGAGALIVQATNGPSDLLSIYLGADGKDAGILNIPGGGSRHPGGNKENLEKYPPFIQMEGKEVFKRAVTRMSEAATKALELAGKTADDLKLLIPHQANLRIIDAVAKRLSVDDKKVFRNVHKYGNMSAATTIIALDEAQRSGQVQRGELVELIAFGGGLTWASAVIRW